MAVTAVLIGFLAELMIGVPIAFALVISGIAGIVLVTGNWDIAVGILKTSPYRTAANYTLSTVPMFILMAYFISASRIASDLFTAVANWLPPVRGGLSVATVFACGIFGAMSGSSAAAANVMSAIAWPNMRRFGYSDVLSAGTVAVGSTLAILIPPSITMVVYGIATETSIGKLLIAGVMPGILLGILLSITVIVWVKLNPSHAPVINRVTWSERWASLGPVVPSVFLILLLMGLLYSGLATPTELAALGAAASLALGLLLRRMDWASFVQALRLTLSSTTMIFMILIGSGIFGYFLTLSQLPQQLIAAVVGANLPAWLVVIMVAIMYFVISMFMDELPLLLITLPFTFPLVTKLGYDPVWFGVFSILLVAMGLVFPPVGLLAFIVSASTRVELVKVYKGTTILVIPIVITLILVLIFPQIALWLPSTMK